MDKVIERVKEIHQRLHIPYKWSYGSALTRFFTEIKDNKRFVGQKCQGCGKVILPPLGFCSVCFVPTTEWVVVSDVGELHSYSTIHYNFPGQPTTPPYVYIFIKLDGTDTFFQHITNATEDKLRVGMKLRAVWNEERKGIFTISSILSPLKIRMNSRMNSRRKICTRMSVSC